MIDMFRSRRTYNERCRWWSRNEQENDTTITNGFDNVIVGNSEELIMKKAPSGYFYAKEVSSESHSDLIVAGMYRVDKIIVTIATPDDLTGIKQNDYVEYQGKMWVVENFQTKKFRIQSSEFATADKVSHDWYLTLRR